MALNSFAYLALAGSAVLLVPAARGWLRVAIFLALNLGFAWSYWGVAITPVAVSFCLAGYLCAQLARRRGPIAVAASLAGLTAAFVFLRVHPFAGATAQTVPTAARIIGFAGLSFLYFKMVHVIVDAASGSIEDLSIDRYLNYCLNFTTVLMGPIQRYQDFSAQWSGEGQDRGRCFEDTVDAANRILRGLVKAFVLAPYLAPYVLQPGLPIEILRGWLLLRIYAFYVFLYLDFSGYCDIVIGVGSLMDLRPPENFHFPFLARDVSSYWLRVHRSLTLWLTDYIFTPLYRLGLRTGRIGRHGFVVLAVSLLVTMLVAGAWHGIGLNFILFGLIHGIALVVVRGYEQGMVRWMGRARFRRFAETPYVTAAAVFLTYNFTSLAYIFFVLDVGEAARVMKRLTVIAAGLAR